MSKSSAKQRINQLMEWRQTLKTQRVKPKPIDVRDGLRMSKK